MTKRVNNMLTNIEMYKLCKWVEGNNGTDYGDLNFAANAATRDLGFVVTYNNIRAASTTTGKKYAGQRSAGLPNDRTRVLAACVRDLFVKLGEPVPSRLLELLNHKGKQL